MERQSWNLEKIKEIIEKEGITTLQELKNYSSGAVSYLYRTKQKDKLGFEKKKVIQPDKKVIKKDKLLDIMKVLDYLVRYSIEDRVSLDVTCNRMGYFYEYWELRTNQPELVKKLESRIVELIKKEQSE